MALIAEIAGPRMKIAIGDHRGQVTGRPSPSYRTCWGVEEGQDDGLFHGGQGTLGLRHLAKVAKTAVRDMHGTILPAAPPRAFVRAGGHG
ncbi:hypothetical protein ACWEN6_05780 [Sphaerisporangium sp. NPDC004334]